MSNYNKNNDSRFIRVSNPFIIALITGITDINPFTPEITDQIVNDTINGFWEAIKEVETNEIVLESLFDGLSSITPEDKFGLKVFMINLLRDKKASLNIEEDYHNFPSSELTPEQLKEFNKLWETDISEEEMINYKLIDNKSLRVQVRKIINGLGLEQQISINGAISLFNVIKKNNQDSTDIKLYSKVYVHKNYIEQLKNDLTHNFIRNETFKDFDSELKSILNQVKH